MGERLEAIRLPDQFGEERVVDADVAVVLFSRDMDGGKLLREAMEGFPAETLAGLRAAYVADISGMPRLVARLFAVPAMRKRPYPMLLDRDGAATAALPDEEGRGTLIRLDALRVVGIHHLGSVQAIRERLGLPQEPPEEGAPN